MSNRTNVEGHHGEFLVVNVEPVPIGSTHIFGQLGVGETREQAIEKAIDNLRQACESLDDLLAELISIKSGNKISTKL